MLARRQSSVTEGRKQFLGATKLFPVNSRVKIIKKGLLRELCAKFHEFWDDDQKNGLHREICDKTVLAPHYWVDDQYFGGLSLRTALLWNRVCYVLWSTILVWGIRPRNVPRGAGPVSTCFVSHNFTLCYKSF